MREIKFRGKRVDNGEWVYGGFYRGVMPETENPFSLDNARIKTIIIQEGTYYHVDPSTVGQFTGLKDKNGKEIYEVDICNCREYECFGIIKWNEDVAGFYFYVAYEDGTFDEESVYDYADELEVIGNIHDNPELLEV